MARRSSRSTGSAPHDDGRAPGARRRWLGTLLAGAGLAASGAFGAGERNAAGAQPGRLTGRGSTAALEALLAMRHRRPSLAQVRTQLDGAR